MPFFTHIWKYLQHDALEIVADEVLLALVDKVRLGVVQVKNGAGSSRWIVGAKSKRQGRNWINFRGGRKHICERKDELIHGISQSIKCRRGRTPPSAPTLVAPLIVYTIYPTHLLKHLSFQLSFSNTRTVRINTNLYKSICTITNS